MPFGVELPEDLGKPSTEAAPVEGKETTQDLAPEGGNSPEGSAPSGAKSLPEAQKPEGTKEPLDLDKLESFRFAGRDWSPKDLKNAYLMREDYTRKTQEVAEARKYTDNFPIDMQAVIQNPSLMNKLRAVYPKEFVAVAEKILATRQVQGTQEVTSTQKPSDDFSKWRETVESKLSTIDQWQEAQRQNEVKSIESWLDNQYAMLSTKYPLAHPEIVTARARTLSEHGHKIDEKALDKLFKENHDELNGKFEKTYKEKVNKQLEAGSKSKDTGSGGGTPGKSPGGPRNLKEAKEAMLKDLGAN